MGKYTQKYITRLPNYVNYKSIHKKNKKPKKKQNSQHLHFEERELSKKIHYQNIHELETLFVEAHKHKA